MPEHRPPHRRHEPRAHLCRVRRRHHQGKDHGRLRRGSDRMTSTERNTHDQHHDRRVAQRCSPAASTSAGCCCRAGRSSPSSRSSSSSRSCRRTTSRSSNLLTMSSHVAVYAILSIGMLLVILNGGIDLSVGSTLGFSGVIAGFFMKGVAIGGVDALPEGLGGRDHLVRRRSVHRVRQRHPRRAVQGRTVRGHARHALRRPRHRAPHDQRPDVQQPRRAVRRSATPGSTGSASTGSSACRSA